MQTKFQIVSTKGGTILTREEFEAKYGIQEIETGTHLRPELIGKPRLADHCGPMWGGYHDSEGNSMFGDDAAEKADEVWIRYETWDAYEMYSR